MSFFLLDANAVGDLMQDYPRLRTKDNGCTGQIVTCAIVRGEIRYGMERLPMENVVAILKPKPARSSQYFRAYRSQGGSQKFTERLEVWSNFWDSRLATMTSGSQRPLFSLTQCW